MKGVTNFEAENEIAGNSLGCDSSMYDDYNLANYCESLQQHKSRS